MTYAFPNGWVLDDYQEVGARFLTMRPFAILGDAPRLGKLVQAAAALNWTFDGFDDGVALIICPAHVVENWRKKLADLRVGRWRAFVVSYEMAAKGKLPPALPGTVHVLILDEGHNVKNRSSNRAIAILGEDADGTGLVSRAGQIWVLSGTIAPNTPMELWPLLHACAPDVIKFDGRPRPLSYSAFQDKFCTTIRTTFGRKVVGSRRLTILRERLLGDGPKDLRAVYLGRDDSVLPVRPEFPPPENVYLEVNRADLNRIRSLEETPEGRKIKAALARGDSDALLGLGAAGATLRRMVAMAKTVPLAEMIADELADNPGMKMVVFAWHREPIAELEKRLRKYGAVSLVGGMPSAKQEEVKNRFQTDPKCRVIIGQIKAAGEGIDLSAADELIFLEQSWVPGDNEQAARRLFNVKKRRGSRVRIAVLPGTTDEGVQDALRLKLAMIKKLFGAC